MLGREDLNGAHFKATMKPMETGEIRLRMKPGPALEMRTKAVHVTKATEFGWQGQFHCHRHQFEFYAVVSGIIGSVSWNRETGKILQREWRSCSRFWFHLDWWHDIYTTPGSEFITVQSAEPGVDVEADREVLPQSEIPSDVVQAQTHIAQSVQRSYRGVT